MGLKRVLLRLLGDAEYRRLRRLRRGGGQRGEAGALDGDYWYSKRWRELVQQFPWMAELDNLPLELFVDDAPCLDSTTTKKNSTGFYFLRPRDLPLAVKDQWRWTHLLALSSTASEQCVMRMIVDELLSMASGITAPDLGEGLPAHKCRPFLSVLVADLVAQAKLLCRKGHAAARGCWFCDLVDSTRGDVEGAAAAAAEAAAAAAAAGEEEGEGDDEGPDLEEWEAEEAEQAEEEAGAGGGAAHGKRKRNALRFYGDTTKGLRTARYRCRAPGAAQRRQRRAPPAAAAWQAPPPQATLGGGHGRRSRPGWAGSAAADRSSLCSAAGSGGSAAWSGARR
jgi:hypothetical protein